MKCLSIVLLFGTLTSSNACPICFWFFPEPLTTNTLLDELYKETGQVTGNNVDIHATLESHESLCKNSGTDEWLSLSSRTSGLIYSILDFVEKNRATLDNKNLALALAMLKVYDDKHQSVFQSRYNVDHFISEICSRNGEDCEKATKNWKPIHNPAIAGFTLSKEIESMLTSTSIGRERVNLTEGFVPKCESSLLRQCNLDHECRSVFLESSPSTQYILSHQFLYRMMVQKFGCESLVKYNSDHAEQNLCTKMYMESHLISQFNFPAKKLDLLVENVALCGFRGYSNFFRADWLNEILKWNGESTSSCLTHKNLANADEIGKSCDTHLMSVSLAALAGFWDHLQKEC